jgi:ribosomal protein L22
MSKVLKKKFFSVVSQNSTIIGYIQVNAKYNYKITQNLKKVLKSLRKCSFYKSVEILSNLSNNIERTFILQIIYSAVTYAENNHYANLLKVWIDNIYIKKVVKSNKFLNEKSGKLENDYYIILNLGFEYKAFPVKKESIW